MCNQEPLVNDQRPYFRSKKGQQHTLPHPFSWFVGGGGGGFAFLSVASNSSTYLLGLPCLFMHDTTLRSISKIDQGRRPICRRVHPFCWWRTNSFLLLSKSVPVRSKHITNTRIRIHNNKTILQAPYKRMGFVSMEAFLKHSEVCSHQLRLALPTSGDDYVFAPVCACTIYDIAQQDERVLLVPRNRHFPP